MACYLSGKLSAKNSLAGKLSAKNSLAGKLSNGVVKVTGSDIEVYSGEYSVTPKVVSQILDTENKLLKKNVTIESIPYYAVDNNFDGQTIIIGE